MYGAPSPGARGPPHKRPRLRWLASAAVLVSLLAFAALRPASRLAPPPEFEWAASEPRHPYVLVIDGKAPSSPLQTLNPCSGCLLVDINSLWNPRPSRTQGVSGAQARRWTQTRR